MRPLDRRLIRSSTALDVNLLGLGVSTGLGPSVTPPPNVQSGSFAAATATFVNSATPCCSGTAQITGLTGATQTGSAQLSVVRPACAGATVSVGVTGSGSNFKRARRERRTPFRSRISA